MLGGPESAGLTRRRGLAGDESPLMAEVASYLECAGLNAPLAKIYATAPKLASLSLTLVLFVLAQLPRLVYARTVSSLLARKPGEPLDGPAFVVGLVTLLKQFHVTHTHRFLAYLVRGSWDPAEDTRPTVTPMGAPRQAQYVRAVVEASAAEGKPAAAGELPAEVITVLAFLDEFLAYAALPRKVATLHFPPYIFDEFRAHAA